MPYSTAPLLAWAGWRLKIPGGPHGGQYHGFIAPDDVIDGMGWPAGHDEIFRPIDSSFNLGIYPWHGWDPSWVGTPLSEGETVSDFVYRSPAEVRPRPNASGGINVIRGIQLARTPGFAVAPGNYRHLGGMGAVNPQTIFKVGPTGLPWYGHPEPYPEPYCPRLRPGEMPTAWCAHGPTPVVTQPPPPYSPQPSPIIPIGPYGGSGCAVGQYRDAAGNCVSDWTNPYPMPVPMDNPAAPAPSVSANTCPSGYQQDPTNPANCLPPGVCPTGYSPDPSTGACTLSSAVSATPGTGFTGWLSSSTSVFGANVPNSVIAIGLGFAAFKLIGGGGGKRR